MNPTRLLAASACAAALPLARAEPDLVVEDLVLEDTTVNPGQVVDLEWMALNQGDMTSGSNTQAIMWSVNSAITFNDEIVGSEPLGFLFAGADTREVDSFTVPSDAVRGNSYYVGVIIDFNNEVAESDEANNLAGPVVRVTVNESTTAPNINVRAERGIIDPSIPDGSTDTSPFAGTEYLPASIFGETREQTFRIENTASGFGAIIPLILADDPPVRITGGSGQFTVVQQPSSTIIGAGNSVTFRVRFDPGAPGPQAATVRISSNDANESPYTFAIGGTGTASDEVVDYLLEGNFSDTDFDINADGAVDAADVSFSVNAEN